MRETDNHGLQKPDQGDTDWTHGPDMQTAEERLPIRDVEANLGQYTPHAGATFVATDSGAVYDGDGAAWNAADREFSSLRATDTADLTINVPSEAATLQDAVDEVSQYQLPEGTVVDVEVAAGHQVDAGILVEDGDYGHIRITYGGTGALEVSDTFTGAFLWAINARAPVLATDVNMRNVDAGTGNQDGCCLVLGAVDGGAAMGHVEAGVTISNVQRSAYQLWQGSTLAANNTTIDTTGYRSIHCTHGSTVSFRQGTVRNSSDDAVYASHSARINARDVTVTTTTGSAVKAVQNSVVSCGATCTIDGADIGIEALRGGEASFGDGSILNCTTAMVWCDDGGKVSLKASTLDGSDTHAVFAKTGSTITLTNVSTANITNVAAFSKGSDIAVNGGTLAASGNDISIADGGTVRLEGTVSYTDTNVAVNTLHSNGIIFDDA